MRGFLNDFPRWVLLCALAAASSGCGGSAMTPRAGQSFANASRMAFNAASKDLLYVSDQGSNMVYVYSYPVGKLVDTLTTLWQPAGICVDRDQNVWIVESNFSTLVEFAHGAKTALRRIVVPQASYLFGCSVDATTGDLAVTDLGGAFASGAVLVFANAAGKPKIHQNANLQTVYFCGYDDKGNLFVDGLDFKGNFALVKLAHGGGMTSMSLDRPVAFPGGIEWDGKYLAIGDREYQGGHHSAIYEVSATRSAGRVVAITPLDGSCDVLQFSIPKLGNGTSNPQGDRLVAPDVCKGNAGVYKYPSGGAPLRTLGSFSYPVAAALSKRTSMER